MDALSLKSMFGLSFFERPILDHDTKAHTTDFITDFMKSGGFHMKSLKSAVLHQSITLTWSFIECRGKAS